MSHKTKLLLCLLTGLLPLTSSFCQNNSQSSSGTDHELVKKAILDYVEGVYTMDTSRIYRSVHPALVKRGAWFDQQKGGMSLAGDELSAAGKPYPTLE